MKDRQISSRWALRFLSLFCPDDLHEEVEGDLIQKFHRDVKQFGEKKARQRLIWSSLRFFRPGIILRNRFKIKFNHYPMFKNYFKTSFRYLQNNKTYSAINLIGLATGMCVCFFAMLYIQFEWSYDVFNKKADRIYRVVTDVQTATGTTYESTHGPLAQTIRESCPEVEAVTHLFLDYLILRKDNEIFSEEKIAYADSSLFSVFTLPLIRGNAKNILNAPGNIVLSETAARKYFGDADPVGQTMFINSSKDPAYVTGVMKDMPYNSHFRVEALVSKSTLGEGWMSNWKRFYFYTYVVLPENYNPQLLESRFPSLIANHVDQHEVKYDLSLEPLKSVYLEGKPRGSRTGSIITGSVSNIYIFSVIAAIVLFIACFNFINLTTAFSMQRAKEIGVRKVMGSSRIQLITQLLVDALLVAMIAFVITVALIYFLLPLFNDVAGKIIIASIFDRSEYILFLLAAAIIIGLLSGIYPAFFLSGFQPMKGLKGRFVTSSQGAVLRKGLVITQFSISIVLIVATIVVYSQLNYMQNQELGFKKDHQLVIDFQFDERIINLNEMVREQLTAIPQVADVSLSSSIPGRANHKFPVKIEDNFGELQEFQSDTYYIDYNFLNQHEIKMIAGRSFSKQFASDSTEAMIINEAAVQSLGFANAQEAIGKNFQQLSRKGTIIGVISDFHFHSVREKVRPLTLLAGKSFLTFLTLNVSSQNVPATIQQIESRWHDLVSDLPLIYFFSDEAYNAQYQSEERFGKLFICFASLAILISCLGLIGLSAFNIAQRTKEIGVRKVLGSSVLSIVGLLSRDFFLLIVFAFAIAAPLAWLGMSQWLQVFAYRIDIAWWMYVLAGSIVLMVAFITISYQTIRAAMTNPIKSLKTE